jgi:hypothetical protein
VAADDGAYAYKKLAPGTYLLRILATSGLYQRRLHLLAGSQVDLGTLRLDDAFRVLGRVSSDSSVDITGLHVMVECISPAGEAAKAGTCEIFLPRYLDIISDDGTFDLDLSSGAWALRVVGAAFSEVFTVTGQRNDAIEVTLMADSPSELVVFSQTWHPGAVLEVTDSSGCIVARHPLLEPGPVRLSLARTRGSVFLLGSEGDVIASSVYNSMSGAVLVSFD